MVMRHFGSKEQLFLAAVPGTRDLAAVAAGPVSTLAERITAGYLQRMEAEAGSDPFVALLRSVAFSDDAAARLLVAMQNSSAEVYRGLLGDEALEAVVPFIASLLIGVTFSRYIVRAGALAEMDVESLRAHLERSIRSLLAAATTNRAER